VTASGVRTSDCSGVIKTPLIIVSEKLEDFSRGPRFCGFSADVFRKDVAWVLCSGWVNEIRELWDDGSVGVNLTFVPMRKFPPALTSLSSVNTPFRGRFFASRGYWQARQMQRSIQDYVYEWNLA